ncbi:conserved hypothetical protein [Culex quinquefasciatus]|uniref:Uncharacterized protein n=1 Tax=Culex quinquefasciatus TaxID=7176 RepID=B0WTX2_CULQU|nr:conserved hypothetical protein [Culex quinquefasciatus]|eukprot:XP_001856200.1 conserved hypothetical protein [Culex quinquefasciatus]
MVVLLLVLKVLVWIKVLNWENFTLKNWMVPEDLKLELDSAIPVVSDIMESYPISRVQESKSPRVQESKSPRVQESKSPRVQESKSPRVQESKSPRVQESKSPRVQESKSPRVQEYKSPRVQESKSPSLKGLMLVLNMLGFSLGLLDNVLS